MSLRHYGSYSPDEMSALYTGLAIAGVIAFLAILGAIGAVVWAVMKWIG